MENMEQQYELLRRKGKTWKKALQLTMNRRYKRKGYVCIYNFYINPNYEYFKGSTKNVKLIEHRYKVYGNRQDCMDEGQPIKLNQFIDKNTKCFECRCINGFVECKHLCPPIDGCYAWERNADTCCDKCKGCVFRGVYHESNTEWKDSSNPCNVYQCHAGIVTEIKILCHTSCSNPVPPKPGQCCSTCEEDCSFGGRQIIKPSDPCLKCTCSINGGKMCTKRACPVLDCPREKIIHKEGECCPRCTGNNAKEVRRLTVPGACLVFNRLLKEGHKITHDKCTKCTCQNETTICTRETCPVLDCSIRYQRSIPNSCCRECRNPDEMNSEPEDLTAQCSLMGVNYEDGDKKSVDSCTECECKGGVIICTKTMCNESLECPFGSIKVHNRSECCPKCIEKPATCMVFGDPHYKTFDGQFYTFKGDGKYQLVADCKAHTFSIRVANAYLSKNGTSTTTKRVSIKVTGLRINLGQKLVAKVNGEKIPFPFKKDRKVSIEKINDALEVRLNLNHDEIKIIWNGRSFLEVTVPPKFKKNLCGLCGNFNLNSQDDFRERKGLVVGENSIHKFGASWCVGKNCKRRVSRPRFCQPENRKLDKKYCNFFVESDIFEKCRTKNNFKQFHKACLMDMCDCPNGKCYCESLMAYAQECKRLNIDVSGWEKESFCEASSRQMPKTLKKKKHSKKADFLPTINETAYAIYYNTIRNKSRTIPLTPE